MCAVCARRRLLRNGGVRAPGIISIANALPAGCVYANGPGARWLWAVGCGRLELPAGRCCGLQATADRQTVLSPTLPRTGESSCPPASLPRPASPTTEVTTPGGRRLTPSGTPNKTAIARPGLSRMGQQSPVPGCPERGSNHPSRAVPNEAAITRLGLSRTRQQSPVSGCRMYVAQNSSLHTRHDAAPHSMLTLNGSTASNDRSREGEGSVDDEGR